MSPPAIRLLLSDVDGTLVNSEKALTARSVEAVHKLHDAGVLFAVTSGRPAARDGDARASRWRSTRPWRRSTAGSW